MHRTRRAALLGLAGLPMILWRKPAWASPFREIFWNDLIPSDAPRSETARGGDHDERSGAQAPDFDASAYKFVEALNGTRIRMPGFMLPVETDGRGVTAFILTPYVGACIHVPPPPPNQLVFVTSERPWPSEAMFDAVWVSGTIRVNLITTTLAEIGYDVVADEIEAYVWE
jgi:hypothetical protein